MSATIERAADRDRRREQNVRFRARRARALSRPVGRRSKILLVASCYPASLLPSLSKSDKISSIPIDPSFHSVR
jgi:hypothetical protein